MVTMTGAQARMQVQLVKLYPPNAVTFKVPTYPSTADATGLPPWLMSCNAVFNDSSSLPVAPADAK
jgi:hypothetical protein